MAGIAEIFFKIASEIRQWWWYYNVNVLNASDLHI